MPDALTETRLEGFEPVTRGKVRDVYDLGEHLLIVATDRISAFDWVNPVGIPDKGAVLTRLSIWWFDQIGDIVPNHLVSADLKDFPAEFQAAPEQFEGRSMLVRKCDMLPIEFVIRGYLAGSGWREYQKKGTVCEIPLPEGLREADRLDTPLFTPATKSSEGHDINIAPGEAMRIIGEAPCREASNAALAIYERARAIAEQRGLILCDTKFEFGLIDGRLVLADEALTPDSSRFWPADQYAPGRGQPSFDKQYVRDFLEATGWDKNSPPPALPPEVVQRTRDKYIEAYQRLTGNTDLS